MMSGLLGLLYVCPDRVISFKMELSSAMKQTKRTLSGRLGARTQVGIISINVIILYAKTLSFR